MKISSQPILTIFQQSIADWHIHLKPHTNPFAEESIEFLLYAKSQIDTIQWHEEDEIRRPDLADASLVTIKRNIDALNQKRTDLVEKIDDYVFSIFSQIDPLPQARMNSETPAWLIDRMSILELKIFHMHEQTLRNDATHEHIEKCKIKLNVLLEQRKDMSTCLDELIEEISQGKRYFKVYRQMKMYNDANLNPSLYTIPKK